MRLFDGDAYIVVAGEPPLPSPLPLGRCTHPLRYGEACVPGEWETSAYPGARSVRGCRHCRSFVVL